MAEIVDFRKLARKAARERRSTCDHAWVRRRSGVEKCGACGDQFPCKQPTCFHVDCWVRRLNLGLVEFYPIEYAVPSMRIGDGEIYDTTDDDPLEWVLPTADTKVEDVS